MDTLTLKNNGSSTLYVNDLGIEVAVGEDFDIIPNFTAEDIIESQDFFSVYSQGATITLFDGVNTFNMSYQDVLDYLTPLTRWDKLDYSYISGKDDVTDVLNIELEELTNGSDTLLHNHDNRYFTEDELSTPNSGAQVHYTNVVGAPSGSFRVEAGDLYFQDPSRSNKWLSAAEQQFVWSENNIDGKYMSVGHNSSYNSGFLLPQDLTITKIAVNASNNVNKNLQIRVNSSSVYPFTVSGNFIDTNLDIDLLSGDLLQVFVTASGGPLKKPVVTIYGKWRII